MGDLTTQVPLFLLRHYRWYLGLTEQEIGSLPDETRVYESVGRMFILSDKPAVTSRLTEKQTTSQEKVILDTILVQEIGLIWGIKV